MRAFVAVELPEDAVSYLLLLQDFLKKTGIRARWTRPELMHMTVAFIPDLKKISINYIDTVLEEAIVTRLPFNLVFEDFGGFPKREKAYTLFAKVGGDLKKLHNLTEFIRRGLARNHIDFDQKPFLPHVTIGRTHRYCSLRDVAFPSKAAATPFLLSKLTLFKSDLTRQGPVYTKLKTVLFPYPNE